MTCIPRRKRSHSRSVSHWSSPSAQHLQPSPARPSATISEPTVVGFFADLWQGVVGIVGTTDDATLGPVIGATDTASDEASFGPGVVPSGKESETEGEDPGDEYGPYIVPNG